MTEIRVKKGEKNFDLDFTLQDADGNALNLSGSTLLLKVQRDTQATLKFSGSMTIVSAGAGTCKYTVQQTDFDVVGNYTAEIEITYTASQKVITMPTMIIACESNLPK